MSSALWTIVAWPPVCSTMARALGVVGLAKDEDLVALALVEVRRFLDAGDKRAGGVDDLDLPLLRGLVGCRTRAVGADRRHTAGGDAAFH